MITANNREYTINDIIVPFVICGKGIMIGIVFQADAIVFDLCVMKS